MKLSNIIIYLGLIACTGTKNQPSTFDSIQPNSHPISQNSIPIFKHVMVSNPNANTIELSFELEDDDNAVEILVFGWDESKEEYDIVTANCTGDVGKGVAPGSGKTIQWDITGSPQYSKLMLRALDDYQVQVEDITNLVSKHRIESDLKKIEGIRHFATGIELLKNTKEYIKDQFAQCELSITSHTFNYRSTIGENLIGSLKGLSSDSGRYLVSGHFDTISSSPGADDNASGTVGMLEVMRVLSQFRFEKTIDFIGFDLEELGLIGSKKYVEEIGNSQRILGLFNFEMIGYPCRSSTCNELRLSDTSIYNIAIPASASLQSKFREMGNQYIPQLRITNVVADGSSTFRRSDHAPFWDAGFEALFITDGANFRNPHYHQSSDKVETLDLDFTTRIVKTTVATITSLAKVDHSGVYELDLTF